MLDFCRPWHTSWLWIWSERSVGCSTWNRVPGSCGGAAGHGPDVRAAGGVGGPPGRDARIFGERGVGRFMWTRLADPRPAGPGCSLEVSTPIQQDRSVGLFSAEPDVWIWAGLPSKPSAWSGLERAVGCFTWNQMDSSTRHSRAVGCSTWNNVGRRPANRSATELRMGHGSADVKSERRLNPGTTEVDVHQPVQRELGCHRQLAPGGKGACDTMNVTEQNAAATGGERRIELCEPGRRRTVGRAG